MALNYFRFFEAAALLNVVVRCVQTIPDKSFAPGAYKKEAEHAIKRMVKTAFGSKRVSTDLKNVLFIVADDLRPAIGAYGDTYAHTPHMDTLASEGTLFEHAYTNFPACAPSRSSFMTGRLPDTTKAYTFTNHFRESGVGDNWRSLPQYFKDVGGYYTAMSGKVFHAMLPPNNDYPNSWTAKPYSPDCTVKDGCTDSTAEEFAINPERNVSCVEGERQDFPFCAADVAVNETRAEKQLRDQRTRDSCIRQLMEGSQLSKTGKVNGFFVACGFHKPHTPYLFPAAFLEHYPMRTISEMPADMYQFVPAGSPHVAWPVTTSEWHARTKYNATQNQTWLWNLRRANYGAISYIDDCIGSLLKTLAHLQHMEDTVVVLTADHGVAINDQGSFGKFTDWDSSLHVPLIIRAPWLQSSQGKRVQHVAELVDLYPTFADLAGLPAPQSQGEQIDGTSLAPLLREESGLAARLRNAWSNKKSIKNVALSQVSRTGFGSHDRALECARSDVKVMGYSVRTEDFRYTAWFEFDGSGPLMKLGTLKFRELYHYEGKRGEVRNIAEDPQSAGIVKRMHELLLSKVGAANASL